MAIYRLENVIQPYAWGSTTAIADLLGRPVPSADPQAELWMGTHPKGPSMVVAQGRRLPLQQVIDRRPVEVLGADAALRFGPCLPFLFKVLAAAQPLSIQAHPSKSQAVAGYARENREGKPLAAADRNYRDDNHKPEIICALTPFWGLNGFRLPAAAVALLAPVCPRALNGPFQDLKRGPAAGLRDFFKSMMSLAVGDRAAAVEEIAQKAQPLLDQSLVYRWIVNLTRTYPADLGVLSPALLNLIRLEPGQAMYLPAGQLHAYLEGMGIELMANSDNVLRGGLTPKHVDLTELMAVVRFEAADPAVIRAHAVRPAEYGYACPALEFALSVIRTTDRRAYVSPATRSVELLLCTAGEGVLDGGDPPESLSVRRGDSFLVSAGVGRYAIHGSATVYKAAVPLAPQ
jgi:mannose-6-phosphate isomerase